MKKQKPAVLLTGITGFIGTHVARKICSDYSITALIRPETDIRKYSKFIGKIKVVYIDLTDKDKLRQAQKE